MVRIDIIETDRVPITAGLIINIDAEANRVTWLIRVHVGSLDKDVRSRIAVDADVSVSMRTVKRQVDLLGIYRWSRVLDMAA